MGVLGTLLIRTPLGVLDLDFHALPRDDAAFGLDADPAPAGLLGQFPLNAFRPEEAAFSAAMFGDEETISKPSPHVTALIPYSDPVLSDDDPYDEFDPDPYGDGNDYSDDMYDDYDVNYSPPDDNDYDDDDYY